MPGWCEVPSRAVPLKVRRVAEEVYLTARKHLENETGVDIGEARLRWFRPDRQASFEKYLGHPDVALTILNQPPYNPGLLGKVTHKEAIVQPPVIWLRATLGPIQVSWVMAHEARHNWQHQDEYYRGALTELLELDADDWEISNKPYYARLARKVLRELTAASRRRLE